LRHVTSGSHDIVPQVAPQIRRNILLQDFPTNDKKVGVLSFQGQLCQVFQIAWSKALVVCGLFGELSVYTLISHYDILSALTLVKRFQIIIYPLSTLLANVAPVFKKYSSRKFLSFSSRAKRDVGS
jgi:hypothetical protein